MADTSVVGTSSSRLPDVVAIERLMADSGWGAEPTALLTNERSLVPFARAKPTAVWRGPLDRTLVQFTAFGDDDRMRSLRVDLFLSRPLEENFETDIEAVASLMRASGFDEGVVDTVAAMLRDAARDPAEAALGNSAPIRQWVLGSEVLRSRGFFYQGPRGQGGVFQFQITAADAPELAWPTYLDVERLQPFERWFRPRGTVTAHNPPSRPDVSNLTCLLAPSNAWRCRYRLFIADAIGRSPEEWREDVFRHDASGRWAMN